MANLKPLGDKVVIKVTEAEEKTASGIYLPDSAKKKPQIGEVVSVGTGRVLDNGDRNALSVKTGDKVLFSKYGGTEVTVDGEELLVLSSRDVLAKVEK
ncbi:MAG: co-chaperone GroES [Armatimonadota bacterium]